MLLEEYFIYVHFFLSLNIFKCLGQQIACPKKATPSLGQIGQITIWSFL